jgi:hypothetical protein
VNDGAEDKVVGDEVRLLYSSCVAEIAGFKQQQWNVTNYVLLVDAAMVAASRVLGDKCTPCLDTAVLLLLAVVGTLAGAWIIRNLSDAIRTRRERLTHIRLRRFTEGFRSSWRAGHTADERPDNPDEKIDLRAFFWVIQSAGLAMTMLLLIRRACDA